MNEISPKGMLSPQEAQKSARDAILIAVGGLIPQLMEILSIVDFGEHTATVSLILAMLMPVMNRILNTIRV